MSPGSSPLSCFLWALVLFQCWRYISAPSALTVWGIGAPELTGRTPAWALSVFPHCRGRSCLGDKRQRLHLCIPQLHDLLLLNLPKGLPVPLLPARLWSAVLKRWEAADSLSAFSIGFSEKGQKREAPTGLLSLWDLGLCMQISAVNSFFISVPDSYRTKLENMRWVHSEALKPEID